MKRKEQSVLGFHRFEDSSSLELKCVLFSPIAGSFSSVIVPLNQPRLVLIHKSGSTCERPPVLIYYPGLLFIIVVFRLHDCRFLYLLLQFLPFTDTDTFSNLIG